MPRSTPETPIKAKRRKGPRPKHIPRRTCVSCREQDSKRSLTRIVRTPDGQVLIDLSGKQNGRGAYLCDRRSCWERAATSSVLSRALNVDLTDETLQSLREFAANLAENEATSVNDPVAGARE